MVVDIEAVLRLLFGVVNGACIGVTSFWVGEFLSLGDYLSWIHLLVLFHLLQLKPGFIPADLLHVVLVVNDLSIIVTVFLSVGCDPLIERLSLTVAVLVLCVGL